MRSTLLALTLAATLPAMAQTAPNTLTAAEKAQGWHLLFDGKTSNGWRGDHSATFPATGWEVKDGMISVTEHGGEEGGNAGDIITTRKYTNFELLVDFRITPGANSGIKYFVDPDLNKGPGSAIGFEYQILDDALHPDAKKGENGDRTLGSLYDMIPAAKNKPTKPIGQWNTARIVIRGAHGEHWLNGVKVVEYERFTRSFASSSPPANTTSGPASARSMTAIFCCRITASPSPSATSGFANFPLGSEDILLPVESSPHWPCQALPEGVNPRK